MGEAEVLLNSLTENIAHHEHPVTDTGSHFIIDPETREITNETHKHYVMQGDHNSQIYTFELPRYIDGHDMFTCNKVKVHFNNIAEDEQTENADVADTTSLELTEDESAVICTWSIERNATQLVGILSFGLEYQCVTGDGEVVYEFNTDIYSNVYVKASRDNSEKAISEYTNILEQWRARIFGAGDSVIADIQQHGSDQKEILESTGNTQRDAIVAKGAEVLDTIPEDYTATHRMADESLRSKANAIICEASGETIIVADSSNDHLRGLKLFGKTTQVTTTGAQLANLPDGEIELGGILWTCHGGIVTAKGTCNAESSSTGVSIHHNLTGMAGTYYVSGNSEPVKVYVRIKENGTERWFNNGPVTLDGTEDDVLFYMQVAGVGTTVDVTLYPMLNAGDKALPWEPYTGGKPSPNPDYPQELESVEPTAGIYGKNMLDLRGIDVGANTTLDVSSDKYTITIVGGSTYPYTSSFKMLDVDLYRGKTIIFKQDSVTNTNVSGRGCAQLSVKTNHSVKYVALNEEGPVQTIDIPDDVVSITFGLYSNNTANILETDNTVVIKGLMIAFTDGDWEPYKPAQSVTPNHTLHGIPVVTGGNYTDSDGQQWICDEIDFERGVYVQRVYMETCDGSEDERWNTSTNYFYRIKESMTYPSKASGLALSTHFKRNVDLSKEGGFRLGTAYGPMFKFWNGINTVDALRAWLSTNPVTFLYELETPIETPLDGTTMAAFKALKTNYPNTTILNDAGAWMSVKYNADTKTYIENPKTLKLVDSSTGVVYELKIVDGSITVSQV